MRLPPLLYCTNKTLPYPLVLSTEKPFHTGKIWLFTNRDAYAEKLAQSGMIAYVVVPGFMIIVEYAGTLDGFLYITPGKDPGQELKTILQQMAAYFQEQQVDSKTGFYNKYRLK